MAWLQPSSADSIWPVWFASSSIACLPSNHGLRLFGFNDALRNLGDGQRLDNIVDLEPEVARSAPMARAVRKVSCACAGPIDATTTSSTSAGLSLRTKRFLDRDFVERIPSTFSHLQAQTPETVTFDAGS